MFESYQAYYQAVAKPFFAAPEWMFGLAWGIIYPLIAIAFVYFLYLLRRRRVPQVLLWVFIANLIGNLLFTKIQLSYAHTILPTLDILVVLGTLAYFEWRIWCHSKIIFALLLPYLLWGLYATVLQVAIFTMN